MQKEYNRNLNWKQKIYTYFDWISEKFEPITDDEFELTNVFINLKNEWNKHEQDYDECIINYSSLLAELILERQGVICLLNERDDNNKCIINGIEKNIALSIEKILPKNKQLIKRKNTIWLFDPKYKSIDNATQKDQTLSFITHQKNDCKHFRSDISWIWYW